MEYLELAEGWEVVGSTSHYFLHYCRSPANTLAAEAETRASRKILDYEVVVMFFVSMMPSVFCSMACLGVGAAGCDFVCTQSLSEPVSQQPEAGRSFHWRPATLTRVTTTTSSNTRYSRNVASLQFRPFAFHPAIGLFPGPPPAGVDMQVHTCLGRSSGLHVISTHRGPAATQSVDRRQHRSISSNYPAGLANVLSHG